MVLVEHLLGLGEVLADARLLLPRQPDQGVDVVAHHGRFGRHRRHQAQLLELSLGLGQRLLGHAGSLDPLLHLLEIGALLALAELLLDGLDLLVEVVLALALLHLALDAATDALLDLQDVELALELAEQLLEPLGGVEHLQHLLLLLELERQVGGDGVGEAAGFLDARERAEDFRRDLLVELNVLIELGDDRAPHGLEFVTAALDHRHRAHGGDEQAAKILDLVDVRTLHAFDQDLDRAIGQLEHLQDVGDAADRIQILDRGLVLGGGLLGDEQDALARLHGVFQCLDALRAAYEERDDHVREHHHVAQRQQRHFHRFVGEVSRTRHFFFP